MPRIALPAATPSKKPRRKFLRRAGFVFLSIFILTSLIFTLFPFWISTAEGRTYILQRLNRRLVTASNGQPAPTLLVDDWTLSWFHDSTFKNLRLVQPDGTILLACPRIDSGLTLWSVLTGNYDVGTTRADQLQIAVTKFSDGRTSLDPLLNSGILHTFHGTLQITCDFTLSSVKSIQSLRCTGVRSTISIPVPTAPIQFQLTSTSIAAGAPNISINATLPPIAMLHQTTLIHPSLWPAWSDTDITASHLPTALLCDFLGLDSDWSESLGNVLETLELSNHTTSIADNRRLTLLLKGIAQNNEHPEIQSRVLLRTSDATPSTATLSIPSGENEFQFDAALRLSAPLANLLKHLNPLLGETAPAPPPSPATPQNGLIHLSISSLLLPLDSHHLPEAQAAARLTFPPLSFVPKSDTIGVLRQLQKIAGTPLPESNPPLEGTAGPLYIRLADSTFTYDNFLITTTPASINFSGTADLQGNLHLTAAVQSRNGPAGLSTFSSHVLLTGTIDSPIIRRAE